MYGPTGEDEVCPNSSPEQVLKIVLQFFWSPCLSVKSQFWSPGLSVKSQFWPPGLSVKSQGLRSKSQFRLIGVFLIDPR